MLNADLVPPDIQSTIAYEARQKSKMYAKKFRNLRRANGDAALKVPAKPEINLENP
jgi:hypothetical protein